MVGAVEKLWTKKEPICSGRAARVPVNTKIPSALPPPRNPRAALRCKKRSLKTMNDGWNPHGH